MEWLNFWTKCLSVPILTSIHRKYRVLDPIQVPSNQQIRSTVASGMENGAQMLFVLPLISSYSQLQSLQWGNSQACGYSSPGTQQPPTSVLPYHDSPFLPTLRPVSFTPEICSAHRRFIPRKRPIPIHKWGEGCLRGNSSGLRTLSKRSRWAIGRHFTLTEWLKESSVEKSYHRYAKIDNKDRA